MAEQKQFVVVSVASNGVVHAWGPYDSRREATNAKNRMKTQVKKDWPIEYYPQYHLPGAIKYSVCEIITHRAEKRRREGKK